MILAIIERACISVSLFIRLRKREAYQQAGKKPSYNYQNRTAVLRNECNFLLSLLVAHGEEEALGDFIDMN